MSSTYILPWPFILVQNSVFPLFRSQVPVRLSVPLISENSLLFSLLSFPLSHIFFLYYRHFNGKFILASLCPQGDGEIGLESVTPILAFPRPNFISTSFSSVCLSCLFIFVIFVSFYLTITMKLRPEQLVFWGSNLHHFLTATERGFSGPDLDWKILWSQNCVQLLTLLLLAVTQRNNNFYLFSP